MDPIELMTTAVTMGTAAVELADVGTSLQSCVGCAMSPDIRNMVDQIVATTDGVLDSSATVLRTEAGDLAQRALIATNDSLAAASLATTPTNIGIIGGNDVTPFTITNPDGSPATPMSGVSVIGGNNFGSPVIVAANGSVAPMGTTAMVSTVGGSWSPDQGTDYLPSPSLDGRPASLPAGILSGSSHVVPTPSTNAAMGLNIVMAQQSAAVARGNAQTSQIIQRNSPISTLPPVERHQLPA